LEQKDMKSNDAKRLAVIGGSAVVALGVLGVTFGQQQAPGSVTSSQMSTGVTVTETTPPEELATPEAKPAITGPAPLPVEEQGLPG
jgi:hypothetical protein